jgi:hypothetical protein
MGIVVKVPMIETADEVVGTIKIPSMAHRGWLLLIMIVADTGRILVITIQITSAAQG